jgi:hypothetical protein
VKNGKAEVLVESKLEADVIITSLFIDKSFIIFGYSNGTLIVMFLTFKGLVSLRSTEDGKFIYELNTLDSTPNVSDETNGQWDQQITGVRLHGKVNVLERMGTYFHRK